jgi:hypothetical protein
MKYILIFILFLFIGCGGSSSSNSYDANKTDSTFHENNRGYDFSKVEDSIKNKISYAGVEDMAILDQDNIYQFLRMLDDGKSISTTDKQNNSTSHIEKESGSNSTNFKEDDTHKLVVGKVSGYIYTEAKEINSSAFMVKSIYDQYADYDIGVFNGDTITYVFHDKYDFIGKTITKFGRLHYKSDIQDEYVSGEVISSNSNATVIPFYSHLYQDIVTYDKLNEKYSYVKNFQKDYVGANFSTFKQANGEIYLSDYGYVEIKTIEPFTKQDLIQAPKKVTIVYDPDKKYRYNKTLKNEAIGKMELIASNGKAIITPAFDDRYRVVFDNELFMVKKGSFIKLENSKPVFVKEELKKDSDNEDMLCYTTVYDPDDDEIKEINYKWSINNKIVNESSPRLLSKDFSLGDKISVTITIVDIFENNQSVTISEYVK